jgi:methionyl-tRNA formyltransferase
MAAAHRGGAAMRIAILTCMRRGMASLALPQLVASQHTVAGVIYSEERVPRKKNWWKRRLKKTMRIGIFGALNGIRMRRWFGDEPADLLQLAPVDEVATKLGVPFHVTTAINTQQTIDLMKALDADLAISLGNSYIGSKVFSIPTHGMINIHHEVLPEFRGAHTVLWQLHEGRSETGYTIHRIDATIDGGAILYRETMPIEPHASLHETVVKNCARVYVKSIDGLLTVLDRFSELAGSVALQGEGRSFTTPSFAQFLRMARNNRRLFRSARG